MSDWPRLLLDDLTEHERAAERLEPRPGRWLQPRWYRGEALPDGRQLDQATTDVLIQVELSSMVRSVDREEFDGLFALPTIYAPVPCFRVDGWPTTSFGRGQRGGLHSDPMVRALSRRAWGDRDELMTWPQTPPERRCSACSHDVSLHGERWHDDVGGRVTHECLGCVLGSVWPACSVSRQLATQRLL